MKSPIGYEYAELDETGNVELFCGVGALGERSSPVVRLNGIRRGNTGELRMVDGGPNQRWFSFDPKYERFNRL